MRNIALSLLLTLLFATPAMAVCAVPQPRLVCAEYFDSQVVGIAKLIRTTHVMPKNETDGYVYTMRMQKILRGKIEPIFSIYEENSSGRANFDWKVGTSYLLFLSIDESDHTWRLDGCGNSGPVKESAIALRAIHRIQTGRKGGLIQGVIVSAGSSDPNPGVKIEIHGTQGDFKTRTNLDGEFRIHVLAGKYEIRAVSKDWSFVRADMSYGDPGGITIENGGCVQMQLDGTELAK